MVNFEVRGTKFTLDDPGDSVAAETFCDLGYEPAVVDILDRLECSYKDAWFFDIGALHGYYSALVNARYQGWKIMAFEPNPEAYAVLKKNFIEQNIRGNAYMTAINSDGADLHFKGRTIVIPDTEGAILVNGKKFDDICDGEKTGGVVIKIDVHGAEGLVLKGMVDNLRSIVDAIVIEVHAEHLLVGGMGYSDIIGYLEEAKLNVYEIENFRFSERANFVPLCGKARNDFTRYANWTAEQIQRERLIVAVRDASVISL